MIHLLRMLMTPDLAGKMPGQHANCEGAREMRIFRKRNENVPEHFLCFGTFFE